MLFFLVAIFTFQNLIFFLFVPSHPHVFSNRQVYVAASQDRSEDEAPVVASSDSSAGGGEDDSDVGGGVGPTIIAPERWHACRLIRGRRYRPGKPGGMRREILNKNLAILRAIRCTLAETDLPVNSSTTMRTAAIYSSLYLAMAFALSATFGIAIASAVELVVMSWIAVTLSFHLAAAAFVTTTASTTAAATRDVGAGVRTRYKSGWRPTQSHRVRRRHGRRRANRGCLIKVSRNTGTSRSGGHRLVAFRGGANPADGQERNMCICLFLSIPNAPQILGSIIMLN